MEQIERIHSIAYTKEQLEVKAKDGTVTPKMVLNYLGIETKWINQKSWNGEMYLKYKGKQVYAPKPERLYSVIKKHFKIDCDLLKKI
jgi:hypothetical protein